MVIAWRQTMHFSNTDVRNPRCGLRGRYISVTMAGADLGIFQYGDGQRLTQAIGAQWRSKPPGNFCPADGGGLSIAEGELLTLSPAEGAGENNRL